MTIVEFHPRSDAGLGTPINNNGGYRPKLNLPVPYLTAHYQGVNPFFYPTNDSDVIKHVRRVQEIAFASGKSYEYNYLIPPRQDVAQVWEYAGDYQAAHSAGENHIAIGVQFCNGIGQKLTPMQILAFRWLRAVLIIGEIVVLEPAIPLQLPPTQHNDMPGAATICPGPAIEADWPLLLQPWIPDTQTPTKYKDINMIVNFGIEGAPDWAACESTGPHTRHLKNGDTYAAIKSVGAPIITLPTEQQQLDYLSTTRTIGEPPNTVTPAVRALWVVRQNAA